MESFEGLHGKAMRRVVAASFAGAMLEWYDFFLFGTASALIFAPLFFPKFDPLTGTIASFATFGAGFFMRPVGGLVFGHFGDRIGRRVTLIWTLLIIGIPTFLIGLLPTYGQAGIAAPIMLAVCRLVQGFGLGGEYGGASLLTIESAPTSRRGFFGSIPQAAASVGIMLATGVFALCSSIFPGESFLQYGWRVPFLISAVILVVGMYIRVRTDEPEEFKLAKKQREKEIKDSSKDEIPLVEVLKKHPSNLLYAIGARLAETVSSNTINAFGMVYISSVLMMDRNIPLFGMMVASTIGIFACPIFGYVSDRIGQKTVYKLGALFCVLFAFPFFMLLDTRDPAVIIVTMIVAYNLGPTSMFAVQPTMFSKMFGTNVRYTGMSLAFQFSAILGGLTPLINSTLLKIGNSHYYLVACYFLLVSAVALFSVFKLRPISRQIQHGGD
jgi:MHS family shikimate/dehydroshikimate transporter-like MFS transporter